MEATEDTQQPRKRINCFFSKKRLQGILDELSAAGFDEEAVNTTAAIICRVLDFDPNDHTRSDYQLNYIHKKAKELGVSTYVSSGRKAQYVRSKERKESI